MIDNTIDQNNKLGRPKLTPEQKKEKREAMLPKIEPWLKSGLSVRKALVEANIANSEFYRMMDEDEIFREQITQFRQYVAVLANSSVVKHLQDIIKRQAQNEKLSDKEVDYLKWFVMSSSLTKEEFGERKDINLYDPEVELQKLKTMLDEIPE
jgi:hypothetical protein